MEKSIYGMEEWQIAKATDLVEVARKMGFTIVKKGRGYSTKEIDSMMISDHKIWNRFSDKTEYGISGGSQVDFLMAFGGMQRDEAVGWLLDFAGNRGKDSITINTSAIEKKTTFLLPQRAINNRRLYGYLIKKRGISKETVDYFINRQLIYESIPYHNIIFLGKDKDGITRFASQRGTLDYPDTVFKGDVAGNDKHFCFHLPNVKSKEIAVFEGGIDLMSYFDLRKNMNPLEHLLALGMIHDTPLFQYLQDYKEINTIYLCLDNDEAGWKGCETITKKYEKLGYHMINHQPPKEYKDYNDFLLTVKKDNILLREWWISFCEAKKQQVNKVDIKKLSFSCQKIKK